MFDENEIFAYGVDAILNEDPQISSVTHDRDRVADLDVAVTSLTSVEQGELSCPLVVCASSDEIAPASSVSGPVAALLFRSEVTPDQLRSAVHAAAAGLRLNWNRTDESVLDDRGRAVLRLLASGASTREISVDLGYSERTIKAVIQHVEQALGARSRAHAVALAMRGALI